MNFDDAFKIVVGWEGGFTKDPHDPGNWTGGKVGRGELKGTKYGVSAASYPHIEIDTLTLAQAEDIYKRNYWDKIHADNMPWILALPLFDAAINEGCSRAVMQLQEALGIHADGSAGPLTWQAIHECKPDEVMHRFMTNQLDFKRHLKGWKRYGAGWSNRIVKITSLASR